MRTDYACEPFSQTSTHLSSEDAMRRTLTILAIVVISTSSALQAQETQPLVEGKLSATIAREANRFARETWSQAPVEPTARDPWAARHPVLLSALIGTGVGFGWATAYGGWLNNQTGAALIGAGVGSLGGLAASSVIGSGLTYVSTARDGARVRRIVSRMGSGRAVKIAARGLELTEARIMEIRDDQFAVLPHGQSTPIWLSYDDVNRIQPKPMSGGAKFAIGAAVTYVGVATVICLTHCGG
jgi:hypothetical protein